MKTLSIECSAKTVSVALSDDGEIKAYSFLNTGLTHSQTLLPLVENILNCGKTKMSEIGVVAVGVGPGSFTGIRIGIATAKGLAAPNKTPCVAVSTLDAIACNFADTDCVLCAVMDARCNQVYNALFEIKDGIIKKLTPDRAIACKELANELELDYNNRQIVIAGDGTDVFSPFFTQAKKADKSRMYQTAVGVALAAKDKLFCEYNLLAPVYLRLPQAQRELNRKGKEQIK